MKFSGTAGLVVMLVVLAAVGGGTFYFKSVQETKRQELQQKAQEVKLKAKEEARREAEANEKAKAAEARAAEAKLKAVQAEKEKLDRQLELKKQDAQNEKARREAAAAATAKAESEKVAADAVRAKAEAETAKAEAEKSAADAKAKVESLAVQRAVEERRKAEAEYARVAAAQQIADAALAKSENERKVAEANAAAEHDRKLRMYKRAETSRAEMLELQRAEKLLALEESGVRLETSESSAEDGVSPSNSNESTRQTNVVVKVEWPDASESETPAQAKVSEIVRSMSAKATADRRVRALQQIAKFEALIAQALTEKRSSDADYYRKTLVSLVPEYVTLYAERIEKAHAENRETEAGQFCSSLVSLPPDWARIGVLVTLITRNEAYYSRLLAGRVSKDDFVKAFRKLYDEARRDKGDQDEREEKLAHICSVLATYVPDFESNPEWK